MSEEPKKFKFKFKVKNKKEMEEIFVENSENQTKEWRKDNICSKDGQKDSSSEKYQRDLVKKITKRECPKSNHLRINHRTLELIKKNNPMTKSGKAIPDGFDWSEDFDGLQTINDVELYYNFKLVCSGGGAQTRTLRDETYSFIETQLKYIKKYSSKKIIFINILDGDVSFNRMTHFIYLLNLPDYKEQKDKCFVGDMKQFQSWFSKFSK